jgi:hypothetical protein
MTLVTVRKSFVKPRGICPVCSREAALMKNGLIYNLHYPCSGAGQWPAALVERNVVPVKRAV